MSYAGDGPIVVVGGTNDPATPIRWAQKMVGELGPNARLVTFTGEGHGQLLVSTCVTDIEAAVLTELTLPDPDTVCEPDPAVAKPEWWDALPVPDGVSRRRRTSRLLAAILGAEPTVVFSEMRTTTLSADDAVAAYTDGVERRRLRAVRSAVDAADRRHGARHVQRLAATARWSVIALGPEAFDDEELQSAKAEVPPDTTVVWLIAVDI